MGRLSNFFYHFGPVKHSSKEDMVILKFLLLGSLIVCSSFAQPSIEAQSLNRDGETPMTVSTDDGERILKRLREESTTTAPEQRGAQTNRAKQEDQVLSSRSSSMSMSDAFQLLAKYSGGDVRRYLETNKRYLGFDDETFDKVYYYLRRYVELQIPKILKEVEAIESKPVNYYPSKHGKGKSQAKKKKQ